MELTYRHAEITVGAAGHPHAPRHLVELASRVAPAERLRYRFVATGEWSIEDDDLDDLQSLYVPRECGMGSCAANSAAKSPVGLLSNLSIAKSCHSPRLKSIAYALLFPITGSRRRTSISRRMHRSRD